MMYQNVCEGIFLSRPNRFIAHVEINGRKEVCHVKNTGRCRELLVPGATVYLEHSNNPERKTKFSLIAVKKGDLLINMDSQAPNKAVQEWITEGSFLPDVTLLRPETRFHDSRFDFYLEAGGERHFVEVKGVTLEKEGEVSFPDAPTVRGSKHLRELAMAQESGYQCHVVFVVQMERALRFRPNRENDPEFADALRFAADRGVDVKVLTCAVTPDSLRISKAVKDLQY